MTARRAGGARTDADRASPACGSLSGRVEEAPRAAQTPPDMEDPTPHDGDLPGDCGTSDADLLAEIQKATEGLVYPSESDYPFQLVSASLTPGTQVSEQLVREELDAFVEQDPAADRPLAYLYSMERTWQSWKEAGHGCQDAGNPIAQENCAKMRNLERVLEASLTDLQVYYFGSRGQPGDVTGIGVSIFIVGLTPSGNLAGVRTLAIWT